MKRYIRSNRLSNLRPIFATHYDTKAAERLAKSGLFDLETSKQIISKLQNEDIHAFVRCPAFLEKYLLGIARMIIEESDGDPEKAANFIATSTPIFNQYLGYIRNTPDDESDQTLRDKLGGAEYDQHFNNEMHYSDVEKEIEDLSEKYYKEEAVEVSDEDTSDYILIPIESYEQMHEMFGGHWTGDGTGNGSGWCHTNGEYTYNNWVSGGKKFYVLAKKNWKDIKFDPVSNARNPKDEYGTSLIAICVGPNGKLENATLRCNHKGVPREADYQYKTFGQLSRLAGFDVQAAVRDRTGASSFENSKFRMLKDDTVKVKGHTLYRIQAVRQIETAGGVIVNEGDFGGYIEYMDNLNEDGGAWVADKAKVLDEAYVSGDALVCEKAVISGYARIIGWAIVYGNAKISGNAKVENAQVYGNAKVSKNAYIADSAMINGSATVTGDAWVYGEAKVYDNAVVDEQARIHSHAKIYGDASVGGSSKVYDDAQVFENAVVTRNAKVYGDAKVYGSAKICGRSEIFGTAEVCDKAIIYNGNFEEGVITKSNI